MCLTFQIVSFLFSETLIHTIGIRGENPEMGLLWIEAKCNQHGFERYKIKVIKKFNIPSDEITPRYRSRPKPGELSCLLVGRDVSTQDIEKFITDYFHQKGMWESIIRMRIEV
jgi:hypothetical protein